MRTNKQMVFTEEVSNKYDVLAVSYTHLDVYKRQKQYKETYRKP